MHFIKKLGLWLALGVFGLGISLFTFTFTASQTVGQPSVLKAWLADADVYRGLATAASDTELPSDTEQEQGRLLTQDVIKDAVAVAFDADTIQPWIEDIIDGTYQWLDGTTQKPDFAVDTQEAKEAFVASIKEGVRANYEALPACTTVNQAVQVQNDPINATCQVPNVSPDELLNNLEQEILDSETLFPEGVYTADNITFAGQEKPAYQAFQSAPEYYTALMNAPYVALGFIAAGAIASLLLASSKRKGGRKLAWRMVTGSVAGLIGTAVLLFSLLSISRANSESEELLIRDVVIPFLKEAMPDFILYSGVISAVILTIGVVIILLTRTKKPDSQAPTSKAL